MKTLLIKIQYSANMMGNDAMGGKLISSLVIGPSYGSPQAACRNLCLMSYPGTLRTVNLRCLTWNLAYIALFISNLLLKNKQGMNILLCSYGERGQ